MDLGDAHSTVSSEDLCCEYDPTEGNETCESASSVVKKDDVQTKSVNCSRAVAVLALLLAASLFGTLSFLRAQGEETVDFENAVSISHT